MSDRDDTDRLSAASLAGGDATGWFDRLYTEALAGSATVPWDRPERSALLAGWAERDTAAGGVGAIARGGRALVVGCGPGRDAEFVSALGFATTAFDIAPTAIRMARERYPDSGVDYRVADLLEPPGEWREAFDLVVESNNVQALPRLYRERATGSVSGFVAPGGTLVVIAALVPVPDDQGPPWPLTRAEIDAFGRDGLREISFEEVSIPDDPLRTRARAVFTRAAG